MDKLIKLKYLCKSFSTPIVQQELNEQGLYAVYGAAGIAGYLDTYNVDTEYLGIVKDGAGVGRINKYKAQTSLLGTLAYIIPNNQVDIDWLKYAVLSMDLGNDIGKTTIPHIYFSNYGNNQVPYITYDEQISISRYLEKKCIDLDNMFVKAHASIEEYKKLKQAIVTQAITQGVRGIRKMKDSGIEWIGEIPIEWHIKKLRYLGACQNGISKSSEYFGDGYPFVSYGDVYRNYQLPETVKGLIMSTDSDRENYSVIRGDVFFTRTSETIEEVGFSSVCLKTIKDATFAGFIIRFRPNSNELLPEYSKYYFRSNMHRRFFVKEMNLVTRASLGQELLKKLPVILPPVQEQLEIADYLEKQCGEIDKIITMKEQYIAELESYKKSLIYEYVTGKKEAPCESVD